MKKLQKKLQLRRKGNNNYWSNEYSQNYAKAMYSKKAPKDLEEKILNMLKTGIQFLRRNDEVFSVEFIAKELNVLHKHVFNVIQKFVREGKGGIKKHNSAQYTKKLSDLDVGFDNKISTVDNIITDAWHDSARHANLYTYSKDKL